MFKIVLRISIQRWWWSRKKKELRILSIRLFHNRAKHFFEVVILILCINDVARFQIISLDMNLVTLLSTKSPNTTTWERFSPHCDLFIHHQCYFFPQNIKQEKEIGTYLDKKFTHPTLIHIYMRHNTMPTIMLLFSRLAQ